MVENKTRKIERDEIIVCGVCNNAIPKDNLENSLGGIKNFYCQYCGVLLNLTYDPIDDIVSGEGPIISSNTQKESSLTNIKQNRQESDLALSYSNIRNALRSYIYQLIYQLLKSTPFTLKKIQNKKELKTSHINMVLKRLWKELKGLTPNDLANQELISSKRRIKNYFEEFQSSLRPYKKFRKKNFALFAENIEFIFGLILGDYEFSNLTTSKKRIVLDLKKSFGFKSEAATTNSFTYSISLIISKKIRRILDQYRITEGNDNKLALDEIIGYVIDYVVNIKVKSSDLSEFSSSKKKKFYNTLEILIKNLKIDWIYRKSFEDHIYKLIIIVNSLISDSDSFSSLTGLERLISLGLKESALFEKDLDFSPHFKLNLTLILCRVIYLKIKYSPNITKLSSQPVKLSILDENLVKNSILAEITAGKKINSQLLKKFYKLSLEEFQTHFEKLQLKLTSDLIYVESFRNYISDLVRLVFNIIHSISKKSHLTKLELAVIKDLENYNFDWFYKKPDRTPFYYLNLSNHSSEEKKSIKKQTLYNDKIKMEKECARCHKILSYNKFFKVNKASNNVRPYCKKCHSELHLIRQYKKKLRVFRELYGLECSICRKGLTFLPSLVLHHPEVDKKIASWREIRGRSYKFIVNFLKNEKVELRCSNCHLKEHATILKHYRPLISKNDLFNLKPNEIRSEILNATNNISGKLDRAHKRGKIREWIKKRYILEYHFDGKCIVCGFNDLAVLEFHHRDLEVENKFKWDKIESLPINQINEIIINQDCVCLCSNCHSNFHSRFDEFGREVLQDYYSEKEVQTHLKKIFNHYQSIRDKILNFSYNVEKQIDSPFEIELKEKDNWKKHILKIFYFINSKDKEIFKAYELKPILNITVRHIYKHLNNFIEKKYVQKHTKIRGAFNFTNSGLNKISEIELSLPSVSKSIQNMFYNKK